MKRFPLVILALFLGGLFVVSASAIVLFRSLSEPAPLALPAEAAAWGRSISAGAAEWQEYKDAEDRARSARLELEVTIRALRQALCSRYHLISEEGALREEPDCLPLFL